VVLGRLLEAGVDVEVVVTRPDRRRGRGKALEPTPVGALAAEAGVEVVHSPAELVGRPLDLGVVVAYGALIRPEVLSAVPMVNVHFSLLPRWRGAAPLERAILAGDAETGVCLMEVVEELDAGGVFRCWRTPIGEDEHVDELAQRLAEAGAREVLEHLASWPDVGPAKPQEGEVTWAPKITPEDRHLDWSEPATMAARRVRIGGAWTTLQGTRLLVRRARALGEGEVSGSPPGTVEGTRVACSSGWLELIEVQPAGRAPMPADAWRRGARLGDPPRLGT